MGIVNCLYVARLTIVHSKTQTNFPLLLLWQYFLRTLPDIRDLLEPLEKAISHMPIPAISERKCSQPDRNILALPVRWGGLGLGNPSLKIRFVGQSNKAPC